jgi:hypothetical protein
MKKRIVCSLFFASVLSLGCGGDQQPAATAPPSDDSAGDDGIDASAYDAWADDDSFAADPDPDAGMQIDDDAGDVTDARPGPPFDAGPDGLCTQPLAPGDLVITEIMIASLSGSGDHGEWFEVASTLDCALDLRDLHGECPRGGKVATFDVVDDVWIPPRGTFVVADSSDPAVTHYVPGIVVAWSGNLGDLLRNQGTTISILMSGVVIDSVTYPSLPPTIGSTLAFPSDCPPTARADWTQWRTSTASWFPPFRGTPNAPNTDVTCAISP